MYFNKKLEDLLDQKNNFNKNLIFIHTPKCAGTYVSSILNYLNIQNKHHIQAKPNEGITFTVIRNPIARFESLLNYRLDETTNKHRNDLDWPQTLKYVYDNKNITLNKIVSKMTDKQILGFSPYKSLTYWTKNVDIIITLENLPKLLGYFGYTYDENLFQVKNVSNKIRGTLNNKNINRLVTLFHDDILLYNTVMNNNINI